MRTNIQILRKDFETFDNGDTTRCTITARIMLRKDVCDIVKTFPGFKKFLNRQNGIFWGIHDCIYVSSTVYTHRCKTDEPNAKLGKYIADTKTQKSLFSLAANFQSNLMDFIDKHLVMELVDGFTGCTFAKNQCEEHVDELKEETL